MGRVSEEMLKSTTNHQQERKIAGAGKIVYVSPGFEQEAEVNQKSDYTRWKPHVTRPRQRVINLGLENDLVACRVVWNVIKIWCANACT